jgi:potassium efflux system protein
MHGPGNNPMICMPNRVKQCYLGPMRGLCRLALLLLVCAGGTALAQTVPPPQRPFSQLVEQWTRQLDRITYRTSQPDILPTEIDALREEASGVRTAAAAIADLARNDLADTSKLLAPLQAKPGADQPPETDAVKAERQRLTEQASISESRVKQCDVIIARADQLLERMTRLRGEVVMRNLLHRDVSPLSPSIWPKLWPETVAAVQTLSHSIAAWSHDGLKALSSGDQDLTPLAWWAVATIVLWWLVLRLRRRWGRGDDVEPGQRDRTIAAGIDGLSLVLVPLLAVWLIGKLLVASQPPPLIDDLLSEFRNRIMTVLLVVGLTATALAPNRAPWRILPFTDAGARHLSAALRRLVGIGVAVDFLYEALIQAGQGPALSSVGALVLETMIALLALPALSNRSWEAVRPEGSDLPAMVGGTWWSIGRLLLSAAVLASIVFALLGYVALASHLHSAIAGTCLWVALVLLAHRFAGDLLDAIAAPGTATGAWVRGRFSLPPDAALRGQHIALLLFDIVLVLFLAVAIPASWNVDTDAILRGFGQLLTGVQVGGVTISLGNVGMAIVAFIACMLLARLVRTVVRDRVMPTVEAPMPVRQSVDAGLNYAGVIIAILIGIGALGIDFTNLAIVLGALSVGIGLGLQNIANNVISGVILLVERPIKSGDWVSVGGHEGFVRRINIRATEIETFERTHVIVPNSLFLQNPVINRTYSDTSSRIEIALTVGFGTDVTKMETILREAALNHPRVLRVPQPIVRFIKVGQGGLEFGLFVFVARLEDRLVVTNDLNRDILARLIEEKILDPAPVPQFRLRDIDKLADALRSATSETGHAAAPTPR